MDQPTAIEGSMYLMTPGMACMVSPGPTTITTVASKKMSVVLQNMSMCPREWNKDPLELKTKLRTPRRSWKSKATHNCILIERKYTTKSIPEQTLEGQWG
jgi:hypothetical protein